MKILLVEDDVEVSNFIKSNLKRDIFLVDVAKDGSKGSFLARTNYYDVIILDQSLPTKEGTVVCEEIRSSGIMTPIIFLTMYASVDKKVIALEKGADDYMTKPFSMEELKARIRAVTRRPRQLADSILKADDLVLDTKRKTVCRGEKSIYLTRKTYDLLEFLLRNRGSVLSRGMILDYVWNSESDPFSNTVEAHILRLRRKINIKGRKDILKNIPGRGYIIES